MTTVDYPAVTSSDTATTVIIRNTVTSLPDNCFLGPLASNVGLTSNWPALTTVIFEPNSQLTSIGAQAFYQNPNISSYVIPDTVTSIGVACFAQNGATSALTSITLPADLTSIENFLLYGCTSLTNLVIPTSVTSIGSQSFDTCIGISQLTLPAAVTSVGADAFAGMSSLAYLIVQNPGLTPNLTIWGNTSVSVNPINYVDFDTNGAPGLTPTTISYITSSSVTLDNNSTSLAVQGLFFSGWNTASNGSGSDYAPGEIVTFAVQPDGYRTVLYAQFKAPINTISSNATLSQSGSIVSDQSRNFYSWPIYIHGSVTITLGTDFNINATNQSLRMDYGANVTINGGNHTITMNGNLLNYSFVKTGSYIPLQQEITIKNINVYANNSTHNQGLISDSSVSATNFRAENCTTSGTMTYVSNSWGIMFGFGGEIHNNIYITNCVNHLDIGTYGSPFIGGANVTGYTISFSYCGNTGALIGDRSAGVVNSLNRLDATTVVTIDHCYNTGAIRGNQSGGICAYCFNEGTGPNAVVNVTNCYNTGNITGSNCAGIIGGRAGETFQTTLVSSVTINIVDCYSSGTFTGLTNGAILALLDNRTYYFGSYYGSYFHLTNCYSTLSQLLVPYGQPSNAFANVLYPNFKFTNCYNADGPILVMVSSIVSNITLTQSGSNFTDQEGNGYLWPISIVGNDIRVTLGSDMVLDVSNQFNITGTNVVFDGGNKTVTIGAIAWRGMFNNITGTNATIQNINIQANGPTNVMVVQNSAFSGLFTSGKEIGDFFTLDNCTAQGTFNVVTGNPGVFMGASVGGPAFSSNATISNCKNSVPMNWNNAAAFVAEGMFAAGCTFNIINCSNSGASTGTNSAGLVGHLFYGGASPISSTQINTLNIINCSNSGNLTSTGSSCGGIAGGGFGTAGTLMGISNVNITGCYNTGNIVVTNGTGSGGICGNWLGFNYPDKADHSSNFRITKCYSTGAISNPNPLDGGIIGGFYSGWGASFRNATIYIDNCYSNFNGGVAGLVTPGMTYPPVLNVLNCYTYTQWSDTDASVALIASAWTSEEPNTPYALVPLTDYNIPVGDYATQTYTINYDSNGATSGTVASTIITSGGLSINIDSNTGSLTRVGYRYNGWNTAADGTGRAYRTGEKNVTIYASFTLYAVWISLTPFYPDVFSDPYAIGVIVRHSVTSLPDYALNAVSFPLMASVSFQEGSQLTSIGQYIFENNNHLTSVTFPNSVTSMGPGCFSRVSKLTGATLSSSLQSVPDRTFFFCTSLKTLTIPLSVTSFVGSQVFEMCYSLTALTFLNVSLTYPFISQASQAIIYYGEPGTFTFTYDANGASGQAPSPRTYTTYETLITVDNSGSLLYEDQIFAGWNTAIDGVGTQYTGGQNIMIHENVTVYAQWISKTQYFPDVSSSIYAARVIVRHSVTSLPDYALNAVNFPILASVTFEEGSQLTSIGQYIFENNNHLTSVTFPNSVTSMGPGCFSRVSKLTGATLSSSLQSVPDRTFFFCTSLKTLTIPLSVTSFVGSQVFEMCYSLTALTFLNVSLTYPFISQASQAIIYYGEPGTFTFTYDANGASGQVPSPRTYTTYETLITVDNSGSLITTGKIFAGWNTAVDGIGTQYTAGQSMMIHENVTVYAQWISNTQYYPDMSSNLYASDIIVRQSVTSLPNYALNATNFPLMASVTFEAGSQLTLLGHDVFRNNQYLTNVTLPDSITSMGAACFAGMSNLTGVTLPASLNSVPDFTFFSCIRLKTLTIPYSVTSLAGTQIFFNCPSLTTLTFLSLNLSYPFLAGQANNCTIIKGAYYPYVPSTRTVNLVMIGKDVTSLPDKAINIAHYPSLTEIAFERNTQLTNIGEDAFSGQKIGSIVIPDSVTSIGTGSFEGASSLTSVTLPASLQSVPVIFNGCTALTALVIPSSVTSIANQAFSGCTAMTSLFLMNPALSYSSIPNGSVYRAIYYPDVLSHTTAATIVVRSSVTSLPDNAFSSTRFPFLSTLYFEANSQLTTAGMNIFHNNSRLKNVVLPDSITSMGAGTFFSASALTAVTLPNRLRNIPNNFFNGCSSLRTLQIPGSVTLIGSDVFLATGLTSVTFFNPNVIWPGPSAILQEQCTFTYAVSYPDYTSNASATKVVVRSTVTSLPGSAMTQFPLASSIQFEAGSKLTNIGPNNFNGLPLTSIVIPDTVTFIGSQSFFNVSGLTSVTLSNKLQSLEYQLFYGCTSLSQVTIPNSVTSMLGQVFRSCPLSSITIPASVTQFASDNFLFSPISQINVFNTALVAALNNDNLSSQPTINSTATSILRYEKNGGSGTVPVSQTFAGTDLTVSSNTGSLFKTGYVLSGWNSAADGKGVAYALGQSASIAADLTLYAQWTSVATRAALTNFITTEIGTNTTKIFPASTFSSFFTLSPIVQEVQVVNAPSYNFLDKTTLKNTAVYAMLNNVGDTLTLPYNITVANIGNNFYTISRNGNLISNGTSTNWEKGQVYMYEELNLIIGSAFVSPNVVYYTGQSSDVSGSQYSWVVIAKSVTAFPTSTYASPYFLSLYPNVTDIFFESPAQVKAIPSYTFAKLSLLTSITLPSTLTSIGSQIFAQTPMTSISIPPSVKTIAVDSFANSALTNVVSYSTFVIAAVQAALPLANVSCFTEDAKILCLCDGSEVYVPVSEMQRGMLVKTCDGYKAVDSIGHSLLEYSKENDYQSQLFRLSMDEYPELLEDLVITGSHSILVKNLNGSEQDDTIDKLGELFVTGEYYRLMASVDKRASLLETEGMYSIWHFALEHENKYKNYGVYANGLLVESCSKRMMEYSGMTLL